MRFIDKTGCKEERIYKVLRENNCFYEMHETELGTIEVYVDWGDWKHDHLRLNWIMAEEFNAKLISEVTTEEDGSDCYSSIHTFLIESED